MRLERAIGGLTAVVVGTVTALAFAQSFHALRTFAEAQQVVPAGWGWMFAATIDGFVLAALLTSLSLSLQGDRGAAPWAVRLLAVTAAAISLVFNLQHVPAGMARWGAAVPPVAVLAGLEVLLLQVRRAADRQGAAAPPSPTAAPARGVEPRWHAAAIQQPDTPALPGPSSPEWAARHSAKAPPEASAAPTPATPALPLDVPEVTFRRSGSPPAGPAALRPADRRRPARHRRRARSGHRPQRTLRPAATRRVPRPRPSRPSQRRRPGSLPNSSK